MTDLTSARSASTPWVADAPRMPAPDIHGWTWVDVAILAWLFAGAVTPVTAIMIWKLT